MPETVSFKTELLNTHCIIDVRTPLEFTEDHLPGAFNVPILSNAERVEIGTIHKQVGATEARLRGLELTCGRFAKMVHQVAEYASGRPIVIYCWRGGLRSRSMAVLLKMSGYPAFQLRGGYKAFRGHVINYFEAFKPPAPLIILHGMTGTGKTTFINRLSRENWTSIDLEGLACHRGSAFGQVGLENQPSQKRFDTLLWNQLCKAPPDKPIILEGESQRIGAISLPGNFYEIMAASCKIWCYASLDTRIARLAKEYAHPEYREAMFVALERIKKKLGGKHYAWLHDQLTSWDVGAVGRGLIEQYYDKLYYKQRQWTPELEIDLEYFDKAELELMEFWSKKQ